ncbi:MAG: PIN domain-containing protein [Silvibacterium sp.]
MILVDTSIWIDHLRKGNVTLQKLLERGAVLSHPLIAGELAMGSLKQRDVILSALQDLPQAIPARNDEVMRFISERRLFGLGIGYIDAHLLAAVRLTPDALLWTRDTRLHKVAEKLSLAFAP